MCLEYVSHFRINVQHNQEGLRDHFKRKIIFTLIAYKCHILTSIINLKNDNLHNLQMR
jgi:hypothetical protein